MKKKHKKNVITNKFRFTVFVSVCLIISIFGIGSLLGYFDASGIQPKDLKSVVVRSGDTVWQIAADNTQPGTDVRLLVDQICIINGIKDANIRPGQIIMVPVD